jgi:hypothetical protein
MKASRSRYYHIRVASPKGAITCRTQSIGRPQHSKRIACVKCRHCATCPLRKKCAWHTQAFLIRKSDWDTGDPTVRKLVGTIATRFPKAKLSQLGI